MVPIFVNLLNLWQHLFGQQSTYQVCLPRGVLLRYGEGLPAEVGLGEDGPDPAHGGALGAHALYLWVAVREHEHLQDWVVVCDIQTSRFKDFVSTLLTNKHHQTLSSLVIESDFLFEPRVSNDHRPGQPGRLRGVVDFRIMVE